MSVQITVDGLDLNTGTPGPHGAYYDGDITAGWDAPEVDVTALSVLREGSYVFSKVRHRTVVIRGTVAAPDATTAWQAWALLEHLVPIHRPTIDLVVHEPTGAKRLPVVAGPGNPYLRFVEGSDRDLDFQLVLIAEHPEKIPVEP